MGQKKHPGVLEAPQTPSTIKLHHLSYIIFFLQQNLLENPIISNIFFHVNRIIIGLYDNINCFSHSIYSSDIIL